MRPSIKTLTLLVLCAFFVLPVGAEAATAPKFEVSGWIPYWKAASGTVDALAHLDQLTTIHPFVYTLKSDGTLFDAAGIDEEPWASLIAAAKAKKVRVIPTVMSGSGAAIHALLSDTTSRIKLEDDITALVKANNFDGIDIDFEGKYAETRPYFSLFLKGLYQRMGNKWVTCTIESRTPLSSRYDGTPPKDATLYANDFVAINKYCDRVNIMAYDQGAIDVKLNKAKTGPYVPVADVAWVKKAVELASQTISKKKIIIGVATYGYEYTVTPLNVGYNYDLQWSFNHKYALSLAAALGIKPVRNQAGELSFSYLRSALPQSVLDAAAAGNIDVNNNFDHASNPTVQQTAARPSSAQPFDIVWWSDAQAIKDKVTLAKKLGVRGVAIFKIDGGEDPAMWGVLPK